MKTPEKGKILFLFRQRLAVNGDHPNIDRNIFSRKVCDLKHFAIVKRMIDNINNIFMCCYVDQQIPLQ